MMYNPPETEAERTMNELWVARRRQEVCTYYIAFSYVHVSMHDDMFVRR